MLPPTDRIKLLATQTRLEVVPMTRVFITVMLLIVVGDLAACTGSDGNRSGPQYVGRFDNDENRLPMLVPGVSSTSSMQTLVYGDGEH